ncbi:MAG TPA: hypothetical protein VMB51_04790 [Solirubrobacteraceae bacterium]|nr:hypothetical protein [Solirubrobacteraceae bacterium]
MRLKERFGKAVMERIEAMPAVQAQKERAERISPTRHAAIELAYSSLGDEAAKVALGDRLKADSQVLKEATIDLARRRDDYIQDRAYRLLSAAAAGTAVQSIPPERQELFAEEEAIGRIPIEQAFERLAEIEPRLLGVKRLAEAGFSNEDTEACGLPKRVRQELHPLVGGGASEDHELLRTTLATSIVHQYLEQRTGNTRLGSPSTAYFDSPTKRFVASFALKRTKHGAR